MPAIATTSGAQAPAAAQYDTSKLHNVRGKWYDLSKFNHPGGTVFESVAIDIRKVPSLSASGKAALIAMSLFARTTLSPRRKCVLSSPSTRSPTCP